MNTTRRQLIQTASVLAGAFFVPGLRSAFAANPTATPKPVRFGLIADVHQDIMHDGEERLGAFVDAMNEAKVDFIVNLGDFCRPIDRNKNFLNIWDSFKGPGFHIIGNHDTDGGFSRDQLVKWQSMPSRYYSQDVAGIHLIVLDANDKGGKVRGYPRYIALDQLEWLEQDLAKTDKPIVVCAHQMLDEIADSGVANAEEVRKALQAAKTPEGENKVVGVFCGHSHLDYVKVTEGIPYVLVNSASYVWTKIKHKNYPDEILKKANHYLRNVCPYKDPLWAVATLDFRKSELRIEGRKSEWVGPDPWELGIEEDDYWRNRKLSRPAVTNTSTAFGPKAKGGQAG